MIKWSADLATGVAEIDNQHKEIFDRFGRLSTACGEGRGKEEVLQLLLFLEEYVKEHFAAEERLQMKHAYPDYAEHRAEHTRFMSDVGRLSRELRADGATLPLVIMTNKTLSSWLLQHITRTDMAFARYLLETGSA